MELKRQFLFGFTLACFLFSCANFAFKYYGLAGATYDKGTLQGPNASDDLPFSKCAPNAESKFPCVVMFTKDFLAFKQDYEDTKQKLSDCQGQ
jgi:hypothetical protein